MNKTLIFLSLFIWGGTMSFGQTPAVPRFHLVVEDTMTADNVSNRASNMEANLFRVTNFNPSIDLSDSTLFYTYDSLRTDGMATIVTVYETDADSIVGLWQIGNGNNRVLWLNSQQASYENFAITYRDATEQGVIIHTMLYQYPRIDSIYDGHDTLYIGREGTHIGEKNFCEMFYFSGRLDFRYQQQLESALAIRYGALLHGPYFNSQSDTLWNTLGCDSLYSLGICGIGRDDSLSLLQPQSIIRNDYLAIETLSPFENLSHVMMGHNGGAFIPGDDMVLVDTVQYIAVDRHWKLRVHSNRISEQIRITIDIPVPTDALRLMLTNGDGTEIFSPMETEGIIFDSITISEGQDYILTLLVDPSALPNDAKGDSITSESHESVDIPTESVGFRVVVHPNPTAGHYTAEVNQNREDNIGIQVLDASGRIIEQHITNDKYVQYKHTGILDAAGVYYVTVSSNGKQKTIKVIVVK